MTTKKKVSKKKVSKKKVSKKKALATKKPSKTIIKVSKSMTAKFNKFLVMKDNITKAGKQLTEMKSEAFKLETELLEYMQETDQLGFMGSAGVIKVKETDVFNASDWKKIEAHITKTGDFGLLQKRLSSKLLKEYWDDGVKIKGIEHMTKTSLSATPKK